MTDESYWEQHLKKLKGVCRALYSSCTQKRLIWVPLNHVNGTNAAELWVCSLLNVNHLYICEYCRFDYLCPCEQCTLPLALYFKSLVFWLLQSFLYACWKWALIPLHLVTLFRLEKRPHSCVLRSYLLRKLSRVQISLCFCFWDVYVWMSESWICLYHILYFLISLWIPHGPGSYTYVS